MISKNAILIKFIIIKNYQWKSLNQYENESKYEIEYINLNTKSCDNYMITKNISRNQKKKLEFELKKQEKWTRIKSYKK